MAALLALQNPPSRKLIEVVGCSPRSWEDAARNAVESACGGWRELCSAEVTKLDMKVEDGRIVGYRARVSVSFKDAA